MKLWLRSKTNKTYEQGIVSSLRNIERNNRNFRNMARNALRKLEAGGTYNNAKKTLLHINKSISLRRREQNASKLPLSVRQNIASELNKLKHPNSKIENIETKIANIKKAHLKAELMGLIAELNKIEWAGIYKGNSRSRLNNQRTSLKRRIESSNGSNYFQLKANYSYLSGQRGTGRRAFQGANMA